MIKPTTHAIRRYIERVHDCSEAEAASSLSSPMIELAAKFGAPFVKLSTGQRIVLRGNVVVTVLPADTRSAQLGARGDDRFIEPI